MKFLGFLGTQLRWKVRKRYGRLEFHPVRTKSLERQLGIVKTARREGDVNQPAESATDLSAAERQIIEACSDLHRHTTKNYLEAYALHQADMSELRTAWHEDRFSGLLRNAERACSGVIRDNADALKERWQRLETATSQLAHFRKMNGLRDEPANYEGQLWKFAVLFALLVAESILNAKMFAEASASYLVGGFMEAFLFALPNVACSAGFGFLMRFGNSRKYALRRLGMAARLAWGPLIVAFQLGLGHYRDSLMAGVAEPGRAAISSLLTNPLALQDIHSVLLVVLGLMGAALAVCEGYRLDDRVPQQGSYARQVSKAKGAYADMKTAILERLEDIVDEGREAVRNGYAEAQKALVAYGDGLRDALMILRNYAGLSEHLQATCVRLVRLFRELNTAERSEPPPAYFSQDVTPPFAMDPELSSALAQAQADMEDFKTHEALRRLKATADETEGAMDALESKYWEEAYAVFEQIEDKAAAMPQEKG